MISATFSLVQQLTRLHAMPSVKIVHTDDDIAGQVYSPVINVMIMIGTVALSEYIALPVLLKVGLTRS